MGTMSWATNCKKTQPGNNTTFWEATCSSTASEAPPLAHPMATEGNVCFEVGMCLCCPVGQIIAKQAKQLLLFLKRGPAGSAIRSLLGESSLVLRLLGASRVRAPAAKVIDASTHETSWHWLYY